MDYKHAYVTAGKVSHHVKVNKPSFSMINDKAADDNRGYPDRNVGRSKGKPWSSANAV